MTADRVMDGRVGPTPPAATTANRRRSLLKRTLLGSLAVLGLAAAAQYGTDYWRTGRFLMETDDAYVQADNTLIAPRVSGYISEVAVADNQPVKAGQVLARIDDRDFQAALRQAVADRETAEAEIRSIDSQLELQNSTIDQASLQVTSAERRAALRAGGSRPLRRAVQDRRGHRAGRAADGIAVRSARGRLAAGPRRAGCRASAGGCAAGGPREGAGAA